METIIKNLQKLDLSSNPIKEVKAELNKLGKLGLMTKTYYKGKLIDRAVNNSIKEPIFTTKDRISYTPLEFVSNYQRVSIPNSSDKLNDGLTVFYGGTIPENVAGKELVNARIIVAAEACPLIRDADSEEKEAYITFGKWQVKESLNLVVMVDPGKTYKINDLNELVKDYNKELDNGDS